MSNLADVICEIKRRGSDAEIRTTRDGIKVFEVKRRLVAVISDGKEGEVLEDSCH